MSKRACPFEEHSAPQRKVHVSVQDIDSNNKSAMKAVFESTLRKLFEGAKNNAAAPIIGLSCDCKNSPNNEISCSYCVRPLCKECGRLCHTCDQNFCETCSLIVYKDSSICTCLTCYN